jgi:DnaJ-class molecular chaperone
MKWHPDRCQGAEATEKMAEINMANDVLGDEEKRAWYDRFGTVRSEVG